MKDSWKEQVYRIVINEKAKIVCFDFIHDTIFFLFSVVLIQYINNIFREGRSFIPAPVIMIYTYFEIGSNFKNVYHPKLCLKTLKTNYIRATFSSTI